MYRSNTCGELRLSDAGKEVTLAGWVQRTVFTLKYLDNMKYSEISKILSTSEGALKASYHLAVKKITEFLQKY